MNNTLIKNNQKKVRNAKIAKCMKKAILFMTVAMCMISLAGITAFAAATTSGKVNTTDFIEKTIIVLQSVVSLIGAGLGIWGVINLIEGYSGDNAAAKSQGIKQLMAGLGLILVGLVVVPVLGSMMTDAMK